MGLDWPMGGLLEQKKPQRSRDQNAMYWALLSIIGDHTGMNRNEVHNAMRGMFLGFVQSAVGPIPRSTTKLTRAEMSEYMEAIAMFAATELNLRVPMTPEEWAMYEAGELT